jgi:hypothetical protein
MEHRLQHFTVSLVITLKSPTIRILLTSLMRVLLGRSSECSSELKVELHTM